VKTRFASKVIIFKECLQFKEAIDICYARQKVVALQQRMSKTQVWVIVEAITSCLNSIVSACVMNQSKSHWTP
jgi:hypothetical protein